MRVRGTAGHPRPQLPCAGAEGALAGSIKLSASPMGSAAHNGLPGSGPRGGGKRLKHVCTQTWELGKRALLNPTLGLSAGKRAGSTGTEPTWGLVRAPQLCRDLRASGALAGKPGAACYAGRGGVRLGSTISPEPHLSALQPKGLGLVGVRL